MANHPKFTQEQVRRAIELAHGLVSIAATKLKCDPETVRNYLKKYPGLQVALAEEREKALDIAEASLFRAIKGGEAWAVCFFLKTQGKKRGYVERQEYTGAEGGPVGVVRVPHKAASTAEWRTLAQSPEPQSPPATT